MFNSHRLGVSTSDLKATAGTSLPSGPGTRWVTSTTYSLAPIPSNGGISYVGSFLSFTCSPHPECAGPQTAPWLFAHRSVLRHNVGQCLSLSPPVYISSFSRSRQRCPLWC